jgi:polysaccharide biosynthesis protein VpsJ
MNHHQNEQLVETWRTIVSWINHRQWAGFDQYDLKEVTWYRALTTELKPRILQFLVGHAIGQIEDIFPLSLRRISGVQPRISATTVAMVARSYLAVLRAVGPQVVAHGDEAPYFQWLLQNSNPPLETGKAGWGLPFTWYAGHRQKTVQPSGSPLSTVSIEAGHAFLDRYDIMHQEADLHVARACGQLFLEDYQRDEIDAHRLCFSYGVHDNHHVINANLGIAAYLTRLSRCVDSFDMLTLARRARRWCVLLQNGDGSWCYWGPPDFQSMAYYTVDHYHTGMVLQFLEICQTYDYQEEDDRALERGLNFYLDYLFEADGAPRMKTTSRYPHEIICVAQGLITLSSLAPRWQQARAMLTRLLDWGMTYMRNADGSFAYRLYPHRINRMPYMRWGQGWMAWGLACTCEYFARADHTRIR